MKKTILTLGLATTLVAALGAAEPKDALKSAAKNLADKPNYSWTSQLKIEGMDRELPGTKGRTEKDGFTVLSQEFRDTTWEAVLKGDKGVVKTDEGWKTAAELEAAAAAGQSGFPTWILRRLLETKPPAKEAEDLLGKTPDLKAGEAGLFSGDLTEAAAKEMLTFGRRPRAGQEAPPGPKNAKGSVKFWVKDGLLTKCEVFLKGTIRFGADQEERDFASTRTIEVKEVGSTKVEAPDEAKKKL
jgi:hypothetical protein